jgi:hypothetical protein
MPTPPLKRAKRILDRAQQVNEGIRADYPLWQERIHRRTIEGPPLSNGTLDARQRRVTHFQERHVNEDSVDGTQGEEQGENIQDDPTTNPHSLANLIRTTLHLTNHIFLGLLWLILALILLHFLSPTSSSRKSFDLICQEPIVAKTMPVTCNSTTEPSLTGVDPGFAEMIAGQKDLVNARKLVGYNADQVEVLRREMEFVVGLAEEVVQKQPNMRYIFFQSSLCLPRTTFHGSLN